MRICAHACTSVCVRVHSGHFTSCSGNTAAACLVTLVCMCVCVAPQPGSLVLRILRQEYWSGLPFPSPGDLANPGIKPRSLALQEDSLPSEPTGKPNYYIILYVCVCVCVCVCVIFLATPFGTWDLSSWPGIQPMHPALGVLSLNHWTAREVMEKLYFNRIISPHTYLILL